MNVKIQPFAGDRDPKFREMFITVPEESEAFMQAVLRHTTLIRFDDLVTIGKIYKEYTAKLLKDQAEL